MKQEHNEADGGAHGLSASVFGSREPVAKVCYAQMVKQFLSRDPFECVLCGGRMVYRRAIAGLNVSGLKKNARDISLLRYMPA
ncbi:putative transposase, IS1294 [Escherichia coli]|nr:putative transposase, IS1294 [Escherichia coli]SQN14603.1 putative transposase, IS1294 [Escherichia coli]